jgi:Tfp pilus assembly protein PilZ
MARAQERRASERIPITLPISFRRVAQETGFKPGQSKDISRGGLKLQLSGEPGLKEGEPISIRVDLDDLEGLITLQGQVRWLKPRRTRAKGWDVGVMVDDEGLNQWNRLVDRAYQMLEQRLEELH